jgi:hypothetical protein
MSVGVMKDYKLKLGSYAPRIHWVCYGSTVSVETKKEKSTFFFVSPSDPEKVKQRRHVTFE